jgi:hypothetical protein
MHKSATHEPTAHQMLRRGAAAVVLLPAAVLIVAVWVVGFDFARLYGLEGTLSVALLVAVIGGLLVAGLLLGARRLAGLHRPAGAMLLAGALLLSVATATIGAMVGDRQGAEGAQMSASACDGDVGRDLGELARTSGQLAAGEETRPNSGVVLQNGSATYGTSTGECIALVNAQVADAEAAAVSLGWTVENSELVISPAGVPVNIGLDDDQPPDTHPTVRLSASR